MKHPTTMRTSTLGELHGKNVPPRSRPMRSIKMKPRTVRLPSQSMAFRPSMVLVLGLCTSRNMTRRINVTAQMGRLIQKFHRQLTSCVKVPPIIGPTPPGTELYTCTGGTSLYGSTNDQDFHRRCCSADCRANSENNDSRKLNRFASPYITQFGPYRTGG